MKAGSKANTRRSQQGETPINLALERHLCRNLTAAPDRRKEVAAREEVAAPNQQLASVLRLTDKFEAYLASRSETRNQFAKRAGISVWTLRRVFPKEVVPTRDIQGILNEQLLRKICDATEGSINWSDIAGRCSAPALTRKFEAYLKSRGETRAMFADRIGVTTSWLSRVFPLNPMKEPRCLGVDAALVFCIGTQGYLNLVDFHTAGMCPSVQDVIRLCGKAESGSAHATSVR